MKSIFIAILLVQSIISIRIFYIGGGSNENSTIVFSNLANVIPGRSPQPKKCDDNWITTKCPRIAVLTSAAPSEAVGNDQYSNDTAFMSYRTLFYTYGLTSKHVSVHIDNYLRASNLSTAEGQINLQIIKQADLVYFNGGDQARHVRSWLNDNGTPNSILDVLKSRLINNQIVCVGTSAGSMMWANQTFGQGSSFGILHYSMSYGLAPKKISDGGVNGTGLLDIRNGTNSLLSYYNGGKMPAFGFVNFLTDTHFNVRGRFGRIVPVLIDLKHKFAFGVDQNTSLFYDNGIGKVYGWNGVTYINIENSIFDQKTTFFSIKNVTVSYLTDGDQFDFASHRVISNKTEIDRPYYNSATDSNDILSAYEATLLQTRLIDQQPMYNIGKTKAPSDFPRSTPTYSIKFSRTQASRGYYSNKKYTVQNIIAEFSYSTNSLVVQQ